MNKQQHVTISIVAICDTVVLRINLNQLQTILADQSRLLIYKIDNFTQEIKCYIA